MCKKDQEIKSLTLALAERDAMLARVVNSGALSSEQYEELEADCCAAVDVVYQIKRQAFHDHLKACALSASAEPSVPDYPRVQMVRAHKHTCANVQPGSTETDICDCGAVIDGKAVGIQPSAPVELDERSEFQRENRYIVLKRNRLGFLPMELQARLRAALGDAQAILPKLDCVVVEGDWPEYEAVWASIAARDSLERKS